MDKSQMQKAVETAQAPIPKGNVLYALLVFDKNSNEQITIRSYEPITIPPHGEYMEVRSGSDRISGTIDKKSTSVTDQGLSLNITTTVTLE